jgi:hypothetical protein
MVSTIQAIAASNGNKNVMLMTGYTQLMDVMHAAGEHLDEVKAIIQALRTHQLSTNFIGSMELRQVLKTLKPVIHNGLEMVLDPETQHPYYYQAPLTMHLPSPDHLRAVLKVPLAQKTQKFVIYKVSPFPHTISKLNDRSSTGTTRIQWKGPSQSIAISPDKERFVQLRVTFDPRTCIRTAILICPDRYPISTRTDEHCLFQLITGRTENTPSRVCRYEERTSDEVVTYPLDTQKWAVSTTQEERIRIKCLIRNSRGLETQALSDMVLPKGESVLNIPTTCQAEARNLWIPYRLQLHGPTLHHRELAWKIPQIDLQAWSAITTSSKNLTTLLAQGKAELTQVLRNITTDLGDFTEYTAQIKDFHLKPQSNDGYVSLSPYTTHPIFSFTITGIMICLGTCLILNVIRHIWNGTWTECCTFRTPNRQGLPATDRSERIVVNFSPKEEQVRFLPSESSRPIIATARPPPKTIRKTKHVNKEDDE